MKKIRYYLIALSFVTGIAGAYASKSLFASPYAVNTAGQCVDCTLDANQVGCGTGGSVTCTCMGGRTAYGSRIGGVCMSVLTRP